METNKIRKTIRKTKTKIIQIHQKMKMIIIHLKALLPNLWGSARDNDTQLNNLQLEIIIYFEFEFKFDY